MPGEQQKSLTPPEGLRPAQLGIIAVGRVVLGHLSATLADLAQRGYVRIEEVPPGDGPDWVLADLRGQEPGQGSLLPFEAALLDGLFARQPQIHLSAISQDLLPALDRARAELRRDASRAHRLRRFRREQRTPRGEQLLEKIRDFRRELRALTGSGALTDLAAYSMAFGMAGPAAVSFGADPAGTAPRRIPDIPGSRFASAWAQAWGPAFQQCHRSGDLTHQWSAPHDHSNAGHGYGSHGHGGYDSGHGGYGGHGGFSGGGHGGH